MPDTSVVYFDSTMTGAPALSGTAGALIGLLDACLQDGFGGVTLNSLAVADNVATATYSSGHGFTMQGATGPVILIAGATPSGLNGRWRVTVTSATQFTFTTSGISNQTATGTITAKRAPAGFTKVYSGTNKAAYQADDIAGTRRYLPVLDATKTYATVSGYCAMSDVDTGTGSFGNPTYWRKSNVESGDARPWVLIGDSRSFYLFPYWHGTLVTTEGKFFGDICSYRLAGDAYGCALIGSKISSSSYPGGNSMGQNEFWVLSPTAQVNHWLARAHLQVGAEISFSKLGHALNVNAMGGYSVIYLAYPDAMNNSFIAAPVTIYETGAMRGSLPGLYSPLHYRTPANKTIIDAVNINSINKTLITIMLGYATNPVGVAAVDLTGPWR